MNTTNKNNIFSNVFSTFEPRRYVFILSGFMHNDFLLRFMGFTAKVIFLVSHFLHAFRANNDHDVVI